MDWPSYDCSMNMQPCSKKRKLDNNYNNDDLIDEYYRPKRVSPFLNTPKQRKDERRRLLRVSLNKLKAIDNAELCLHRAVLLHNTIRTLQQQLKDDKVRREGISLIPSGMLLNSSCSQSAFSSSDSSRHMMMLMSHELSTEQTKQNEQSYPMYDIKCQQNNQSSSLFLDKMIMTSLDDKCDNAVDLTSSSNRNNNNDIKQSTQKDSATKDIPENSAYNHIDLSPICSVYESAQCGEDSSMDHSSFSSDCLLNESIPDILDMRVDTVKQNSSDTPATLSGSIARAMNCVQGVNHNNDDYSSSFYANSSQPSSLYPSSCLAGHTGFFSIQSSDSTTPATSTTSLSTCSSSSISTEASLLNSSSSFISCSTSSSSISRSLPLTSVSCSSTQNSDKQQFSVSLSTNSDPYNKFNTTSASNFTTTSTNIYQNSNPPFSSCSVLTSSSGMDSYHHQIHKHHSSQQQSIHSCSEAYQLEKRSVPSSLSPFLSLLDESWGVTSESNTGNNGEKVDLDNVLGNLIGVLASSC